MWMNYTCIDLETTGIRPKQDRIMELGAIRVRDGRAEDRLHLLINPQMRVEARVLELTGIQEKELEAAPVLDEVFPQIAEFLGEDVLLGHQVIFDYSFLKRAYVNRKLTFERKGIDTLQLARRYLPDLPSKSLEALCRHYDIPCRFHRAAEDAEATLQVYRKLCEQFYEEAAFAPRELIFRIKKESPITRSQIEKLTFLLDRYGLQAERDIGSLTKNEAGRWIDTILAEYGRWPA